MISFLYPVLGLAALAALIPIIIHLIRRRDVRQIEFPAIRYLRQAEQRHARRLRLRHLLLLATRVLIVLLAAFAAAGPLIGRGSPSDHRPTALAIVIDDSQSGSRLVGGRRIIDVLAERAGLALDLAGSDDRVALFSAVAPAEGAISGRAAGAREYLLDLQPAAARAELGHAIRQAAAWLKSIDDRARELHLLTDMQAASLPGVPALEAPADGGRGITVVVYAPALPPTPNGAVADPIPEVNPLSAGRHATVAAPLRWFGGQPPDEPFVVRLLRGDDVLAVAEGRFETSAVLTLPPQDSGWVQGYVEVARQGLAVDDRRYFTWFARPRVRVASLADPGMFVTNALQALERGGRLSRVGPEQADVWISPGGVGLAEGLAQGRSVLVIPPVSPLDLPRLNFRLARAGLPWRYEARPGDSGATQIASGAPIDGVAGLEVRTAYHLASTGLTAGDTALIRHGAGLPWLVRGSVSDGAPYLLLVTPLTGEASDLPLSAAMVPFFDALLGDWARTGSFGRAAVEGASRVQLPARAREIRGPDGSRADVEGGGWFRTWEAGNYAVLDETSVATAFSVNAPIEEADLGVALPGDLEAVLPAAEWVWAGDGEPADWSDAIFRARRGRHAWRPLVVLLVLVSIVEVSLAAAGRRRRAEAAGAGFGD